MKKSKITLVKTAVVISLLAGLSSAALADTRINIGLGSGRQRLERSNRPREKFFRRPSRLRDNERLRERLRERNQKTLIRGRGCRVGRWPNFYVYAGPRITPIVVERTVVVHPAGYDEDTQVLYETLRQRKEILLTQLQTSDKEQRKDAIKELAGYSFDDTVRQALEEIMLSDPDEELRKEAIRAFAEVKNTQALDALEKVRVEDSKWSVRREADEAIKEIKGY
jgi:hypothetical protein